MAHTWSCRAPGDPTLLTSPSHESRSTFPPHSLCGDLTGDNASVLSRFKQETGRRAGGDAACPRPHG